MALSTSLVPLADKLIARFGTNILLRWRGTGVYDPATSTSTAVTSSQTVTGIIEEFPDNVRTTLGDKQVSQTAIIAGDKKVTVAAKKLQHVPIPGDSLVIAAVGYTVIGVGTTWVDNSVATYALHVRKA